MKSLSRKDGDRWIALATLTLSLALVQAAIQTKGALTRTQSDNPTVLNLAADVRSHCPKQYRIHLVCG